MALLHRQFDRCQRVLIAVLLLFLPLSVASASPLQAQPLQPSAGPLAEQETHEDLRALVDVLQNEQARATLIDKLKGVLDQPDQAATEAVTPPPVSFARSLAEFTQGIAEEASSLTVKIWHDVEGLQDFIGSGNFDPLRVLENNTGLIGTVATTILMLVLLRLMMRPLFARMARHAERCGLLGTSLWLLGSVIIDGLAVLLAFGAGYGLALGIFGELGRLTITQSLYLNAFLMVELLKTGMRGVIAPGFGALRFLPIGDHTARFAYGRTALIVSMLGYGILVVTPIANAQISAAFGRSLTVLVMISAAILALFGIWKLRSLLAKEAALRSSEADLTGRALAVVARIWPWLASLYVVGVFVIAVSRPIAVLPYVIEATALSCLAIAGGVALVTLIGRATKTGVPLPARVRENLPLLGRRLNRVVPKFFKLLRLVVLVLVTFMVLDAWSIIDVAGWLNSPSGGAAIAAIISALTIIVMAYLAWLAFMSWVEYRLSDDIGTTAGARERTLLSLLGNAVTIVVATIAAMLALSELGINIGPLLAGAGVLGLAVGFGAQTLVQDIITGVFIQFENAINTGDVVTVAGTTGTVERLSVRSIGVRDVAGTYHLIPFSAVSSVANFNRGFAYHVAEIGIAYKESVPEAKDAMVTAFERLKAGEHAADIIDDIDMQGVSQLGDSAVVVRGRIRTSPGKQWAIGRAYNELVKEAFDERGIEIPFPHMTVFMGSDKAGKTQIGHDLALSA